MGYRFSLETANIVANLSFGKVISCYRDIVSSEQSFYEFKYFLDTIEDKLYSTRKDEYSRKFNRLREKLFYNEDRNFSYYHNRYCNNALTPEIGYNNELLDALHEISVTFSGFDIKSILLPGPVGSVSDEMTSASLLRELVHMPSNKSFLILQPEERDGASAILNAFPHFEVALRQKDLWPAVLFWSDASHAAFVPINNIGELRYSYQIIQYDSDPISSLKMYAASKSQQQQYLLHLSDLHLGSTKTMLGAQRIKSIMGRQIREVQKDGEVNVLITGDILDSPNRVGETAYKIFADYIEDKCGQQPIRILGNHDVNNNGLAFSHRAQRLAKSLTDFPRIEKLDDYNILLLLFNSNYGGNLAQGEIGVEQMMTMGNLLDDIPNLESYKLIAVLHHHVTDIPTPDFYAKTLFGHIQERALILRDAELFVDWLKQRNVKVVLHGHKHIPFYTRIDDLHVIACGSSTGHIQHAEKDKTYLTYNLLKINDKSITCTQYAEDILGAGEKNIRTDVIEL